MSIQTEIDRIITAVQAAHEKVVEKGGTTTQPYLVGNLASAIDTIPAGNGGSGGSVQTCTVTINSFAANISSVEYTSYENGEYIYHEELFTRDNAPSNLVLNNVIVGGRFYQHNWYGFCANRPSNHNYAYFSGSFNNFTLVPTGDVTITIVDDD